MVQGEQLVDTVGQLDVWHVGQAQDRGRPAAQVGVGRSPPKGWWALRRQGRVGRRMAGAPLAAGPGPTGRPSDASPSSLAAAAASSSRKSIQEVAKEDAGWGAAGVDRPTTSPAVDSCCPSAGLWRGLAAIFPLSSSVRVQGSRGGVWLKLSTGAWWTLQHSSHADPRPFQPEG